MKQICKWISDWMGVLVLVSAILALAFPEVVGLLKMTPAKRRAIVARFFARRKMC